MYSNKLKLFDKLLIRHVVQECGVKIVVFFLMQDSYTKCILIQENHKKEY